MTPTPVEQFRSWYQEAGTDTVALVTASVDAVPSGRMVLLKGVDQRVFVVSTHYESAKARDLAANPRAALVFFWPPDRQVRVSGTVTMATREESERDWRTRSRASQLGAWVSRQSEVIESRAVLEGRLTELSARFNVDVPCPPFWGGYRLAPGVIEFWHHRDNRLHSRREVNWILGRLSP